MVKVTKTVIVSGPTKGGGGGPTSRLGYTTTTTVPKKFSGRLKPTLIYTPNATLKQKAKDKAGTMVKKASQHKKVPLK